jgi:hypothetical protein
VLINGKTQPLAYDLSAPLGHYPRTKASTLALRGLLQADKITQRTGLYTVEPYDPNRIPIVLVHGLLSTPRMWFNIVNAVRADPELRSRYQFWVFYYPTANPPALSALAFRKDLATVERLYHPKHGIVLVGHSMGGIVSRMQAVDTGRVLWDEAFHHRSRDSRRRRGRRDRHTGRALQRLGLYLLAGKPTFHYNLVGVQRTTIASPNKLTPGKHTVVVDFKYEGPGLGKGGTAPLLVDGKEVADGDIPRTIPFRISADETLDFGEDTGIPVSEDYKVPFKFTGTLNKVVISLGDAKLTDADRKSIEAAAEQEAAAD